MVEIMHKILQQFVVASICLQNGAREVGFMIISRFEYALYIVFVVRLAALCSVLCKRAHFFTKKA